MLPPPYALPPWVFSTVLLMCQILQSISNFVIRSVFIEKIFFRVYLLVFGNADFDDMNLLVSERSILWSAWPVC